MWLAAWRLYCKLLQPILNPMLCRVSFLHRESQLTKAPLLSIVTFRAARAMLFTFAQQRGCGNFKSLEPGVKIRELGSKARGCCGQAGELSWSYL
jgi:hypothetical protein